MDIPTDPAAPVAAQYATGHTRARIEQALLAAGLARLAQITESDRVLDAGGGIGGTARFLAHEHGCHVTSVDLTEEFCATARWLNDAVGLGERVDVRQADVTALPYAEGSFDVVVSQHVQMNVADKAALYREARRVLSPGGRLGIWDVSAGPAGPPRFPVPWAEHPHLSHRSPRSSSTTCSLPPGSRRPRGTT